MCYARRMAESPIELILDARAERVGSFAVARVLPSRRRRAVGPFVFLDHMGPAAMEPGQGADVRPHPHIGLATVTYLFEGSVVHRDSVGSLQTIVPGDVNWMTAGRGVTHSERSDEATRAQGGRMHGLQAWVALPRAHEEAEPSFVHHAAATLPTATRPGVVLRVIAGHAYGLRAPVEVLSPLGYVDVRLEAGAEIPLLDEHAERAVYVVEGALGVGSDTVARGQLAAFATGAACTLRAGAEGARLVVLAGAPLDGPRHMWWNFVSSSPERLERAKQDWAEGRFPPVVGDPDSPTPA